VVALAFVKTEKQALDKRTNCEKEKEKNQGLVFLFLSKIIGIKQQKK